MSRLLLPVDGSCVLYLPFWEGAGTFTEDLSRYKNHGTINGATWTDGVLGKALDFNGVNQYVDCGTGIDIFSGDWTAVFWINKDDLVASKEIAGISLNTDLSGSYVKFMVWDDGQIVPYLYDGATLAQDPKGTYTLGKWNHVCWTHVAATKTLSLYVNGAIAGIPVVHTLDLSKLANTTPVSFWVAYYSVYWNGLIDEVRLFNRAMSATEIFEEFYRGVRGNY